MYYQKVFLAFVFLAGTFLTGCNKDKDNDLGLGSVSNIDLNKVMSYKYSELTPEDQKAKLEQDCIAFLDEANALKSLKVIDVLEYLDELLSLNSPEMDGVKSSVKSTKEVFALTDFYGVYTWDASNKVWIESKSKSELKFVYPASSKSKSNNATLSMKFVNSSASLGDEEMEFRLPKSATATLTLDNKEIAKVELVVEYNKDKLPVSSQFKISTEGYVFWYKVDGKEKDTKLQMQLSHSKKIMIESLFQMDINIDALLDELIDDVDNILDLNWDLHVNGYTKLMDNLALVYAIDLKNLAKKIDQIELKYNNSSQKGYCDEMAAAMNQYMKIALIATKDGYKIADIIPKSEPDEDYPGNYIVNFYLQFNDDSCAEASVYFSEGFDNLISKWENFLKAFER